MGLRDKLKRLTREAEREMLTFTLVDGTTARFFEREFWDCFAYEYERCWRYWTGEEPGPPHPVIEALRNVSEDELERVISEQGTMLGHFVGEDERIRSGEPGFVEDLSEP